MATHEFPEQTSSSPGRGKNVVARHTWLISFIMVGVIGASVATVWVYWSEDASLRSRGPSAPMFRPTRGPSAPVLRPTDTVAQVPGVKDVVPDNRGPDVRVGFHGDRHPLLFGGTQLQVTADWMLPVGKKQERLRPGMPDELVNSLYSEAKPARKTQVYTERDFASFLPEKIEGVGQIWALDEKGVTSLLRQFHPAASLHPMSPGRRAGPDGAFATLRAMSASYLDIVCRVHAEFNLSPKGEANRAVSLPEGYSPDEPMTVWYTPAFLSGRMIVNREKGTVDFFRLGIPTDKSLNAHLTLGFERDLHPLRWSLHDIVHVDRMELIGGDGKLGDTISWEKAVDVPRAQELLAREFYKFKGIDWVPLEQAGTVARDRKMPIMAIVTWGALDDQTC
jgi:hypothetical protein